MPNYLYTHKVTGAVREVPRKMEERNDPLPDDPLGLWMRDIEAPGLVVHGPREKTQAQKIMEGYRAVELDPKRENRKPISGHGDKRAAEIWKRSLQKEEAGWYKKQEEKVRVAQEIVSEGKQKLVEASK